MLNCHWHTLPGKSKKSILSSLVPPFRIVFYKVIHNSFLSNRRWFIPIFSPVTELPQSSQDHLPAALFASHPPSISFSPKTICKPSLLFLQLFSTVLLYLSGHNVDPPNYPPLLTQLTMSNQNPAFIPYGATEDREQRVTHSDFNPIQWRSSRRRGGLTEWMTKTDREGAFNGDLMPQQSPLPGRTKSKCLPTTIQWTDV